MRKAAFIAALGLASIGIGTALAVTTPTQLRSAREGQLAELTQPKVIAYPGQARVTGGADSYEMVYSPQHLAVTQASERARLKQFEQPAIDPAAYDVPADPNYSPNYGPNYSDEAAVEATAPKVAVHRGATSAEPAPAEPPELAEADAPA